MQHTCARRPSSSWVVASHVYEGPQGHGHGSLSNLSPMGDRLTPTPRSMWSANNEHPELLHYAETGQRERLRPFFVHNQHGGLVTPLRSDEYNFLTFFILQYRERGSEKNYVIEGDPSYNS